MNLKQRVNIMLLTFLMVILAVFSTNICETFAADQENDDAVAERVDIYEAFDESELEGDGQTGRSSRASSEDYRTWAQADSRWGSISLGGSSYTVKSSGCLVTSVTKLIIQCELKDSSSFTPKTLVTWMNSNSGFTSTGAMYWAKPASYVSGLTYYGRLKDTGTYTSANYNTQFINWINAGYHLAVQVKNQGHWVAVDEQKTLETGEVYIMDSLPSSANADITLASRYSTFNRVEAYKGGTTPEVLPEETTLKVSNNSTDESDASLLLSWTKPKDYNAGYKIERALSKSGPWEVVQDCSGGNNITWVDSDVEPETKYFYRVQPYNEEGEAGNYSNIVSKTTKHIHEYERSVYKKATTSSSGKLQDVCATCGETKYVTISKIASVSLSATKYTYNSEKTRKPTVTVKNNSGNTISSSYYTVTYGEGRKKVGKYSVTIEFKGRYSGKVTKYFTIVPEKTSITKATSGKKAFTLTWNKKTTQVTGYEVMYSTSSTFSYNCAVKSYLSGRKTAKISTYYGNRYYYAKIRTYKTVNGTRIYSGWSAKKKVWVK